MPAFDRFAPRSLAETRAAFQPRPAPHRQVESKAGVNATDVTPIERETIKKLRTVGGWWQGDANAVRVLREYAAKLSTP